MIGELVAIAVIALIVGVALRRTRPLPAPRRPLTPAELHRRNMIALQIEERIGYSINVPERLVMLAGI